jgi:hypothetical protein
MISLETILDTYIGLTDRIYCYILKNWQIGPGRIHAHTRHVGLGYTNQKPEPRQEMVFGLSPQSRPQARILQAWSDPTEKVHSSTCSFYRWSWFRLLGWSTVHVTWVGYRVVAITSNETWSGSNVLKEYKLAMFKSITIRSLFYFLN